jgi:hypothetical protein
MNDLQKLRMVKALIESQLKADLQTVGQLPAKMVIVILK